MAVNAKGFAPFTSAEFLAMDQKVYELPDISLSVATASIEVMVRPTDLIAARADKGCGEAASDGRHSKLLYKLHL